MKKENNRVEYADPEANETPSQIKKQEEIKIGKDSCYKRESSTVGQRTDNLQNNVRVNT